MRGGAMGSMRSVFSNCGIERRASLSDPMSIRPARMPIPDRGQGARIHTGGVPEPQHARSKCRKSPLKIGTRLGPAVQAAALLFENGIGWGLTVRPTGGVALVNRNGAWDLTEAGGSRHQRRPERDPQQSRHDLLLLCGWVT